MFSRSIVFYNMQRKSGKRWEEVRGDTPISISKYPGEADSIAKYGDSSVTDKTGQPTNASAGTGTRRTEGTQGDTIKTNSTPLYKGDNSDTGKLKKKGAKNSAPIIKLHVNQQSSLLQRPTNNYIHFNSVYTCIAIQDIGFYLNFQLFIFPFQPSS
jgi:hypothetical protein